MNFCPPKAGVDRHEKHHIHIVDQLLESVDRRARIECDARLAARCLDLLNDTVGMARRLNMERDNIRSRLCERLDMRLGMLDHEVHGQRPPWTPYAGSPRRRVPG